MKKYLIIICTFFFFFCEREDYYRDDTAILQEPTTSGIVSMDEAHPCPPGVICAEVSAQAISNSQIRVTWYYSYPQDLKYIELWMVHGYQWTPYPPAPQWPVVPPVLVRRIAGGYNSMVVERLHPSSFYGFQVLAKRTWDGDKTSLFLGSKWLCTLPQSYPTINPPYSPPNPPEYTPFMPPPPPPAESLTFSLYDNNNNNLNNGNISFTGTIPDSPFDEGALNIATDNGNWVIEYATAETSYHINLSERYGSSDATVFITSDGTPGTFKLDFYLNSILKTSLYIYVHEIVGEN